jgi:hypothetical protein
MQLLTVLLRHEDKNAVVLHLSESTLNMDGTVSWGS